MQMEVLGERCAHITRRARRDLSVAVLVLMTCLEELAASEAADDRCLQGRILWNRVNECMYRSALVERAQPECSGRDEAALRLLKEVLTSRHDPLCELPLDLESQVLEGAGACQMACNQTEDALHRCERCDVVV